MKLSKEIRRALSYLTLGIGAVGWVLLFAESFVYEGVILRYLGFQPKQVAYLGLSLILLIRLLSKTSLPKKIAAWLLWYVTPALSLFAVFLNIAPDLFYTNFSFQVFHLHPVPMQALSAFTLALTVVSFQKDFWQKKPQWSFFVTPIMLLTQLLFFKWHYVGTWFHRLRREDGLFEYLTAFSFLAISIIAVKLIKKLRQGTLPLLYKRLLIGLFACLAVGSFVVAGEEISWGQRLLGFATPEQWVAVNTQRETTLHNHEQVLKYVYQAYLVLSLYAGFSWIAAGGVRQFLSKQAQPWLAIISPNWYFMPYFIPTLMYTVGRFTIGWTYYGLGAWEETSEMILSLGLLFFMIEMLRNFDTTIAPWLPRATKRRRSSNARR